ncbi:glutamine-synthetase adenylyltransferase [Croceibacterium sp. TMG7-5b_MA50]|uniref:[protein-PII] uridylyltransferase family protein n=1 Tax=Croceibacterium sp. TMG7-5b_MA50 TaxID=3121290 RepID=UPI0032218FBA
MEHAWTDALARARRHSPFLARALERQPALAALLAEGRGTEALAQAKTIVAPDLATELRRQRLALATVLAVGDLAGAFPLAQVMGELSAFADRALDRAIAHAITARVPDAAPAGFVALALGKQGAGELNYSSDIDPILLYDPATLPRRSRDEPAEAAQRYARAVTEMLGRQDADGYVFRVDLRLRPASEVSPPAISFDAALSHYESSAVAWERAAFIRARAAGGDILAGQRFLQAITPFVWRRSLDFTAVEDIRRLTRRIREAYDGPRQPGPGFDLKRGRGGIREIEFFAQTHQLVHGGRRPALRLRGTRAALDALATEGLIAADTADALGTAYDRLRTVEHRLQMVDDRQTHSLPGTVPALDNVAQLDGLPDGAALVSELAELTRIVAGHYDSLLGEDRAAPSVPALAQHHADRVAGWRATLRALRGVEARAAFDAVLPWLLDAFDKAPDPPQAMARWERLLTRLPSAVNLFRLFEQRPGLLDEVLRLLTLSRPLGDALASRPALLDRLIDPSARDLPPSVPALAQQMRPADTASDLEARLDRIRQVVGEERFALGAQLVAARHDAVAIAEGLGRVAEAALGCAGEAAIAAFEAAHGRVPGGRLVILGLGRLGGGAPTHASDLDLVYLFTGGIGVESDGLRPLTASLYFNRLAQRVTAAVSVPTAEGALYEVDTRLRPQGAQGPLAVSMDSFARYQREEAWTWEHMALTRARALFGTAQDRADVTALLGEVLRMPRDAADLRAQVLAMRAEMAAHKPATGPLDVKLLRGGLVDLEFVIHFLQLRGGVALHPQLGLALADLIALGLLPAALADHHAVLARVLVAQRLFAPDGGEPAEVARPALAAACGLADYPALLQASAQARAAVAQAWHDVLQVDLEV